MPRSLLLLVAVAVNSSSYCSMQEKKPFIVKSEILAIKRDYASAGIPYTEEIYFVKLKTGEDFKTERINRYGMDTFSSIRSGASNKPKVDSSDEPFRTVELAYLNLLEKRLNRLEFLRKYNWLLSR